jgi:hypothetical protein
MVFNAAGLATDSVLWSMEEESEGTQKLFALSAVLQFVDKYLITRFGYGENQAGC